MLSIITPVWNKSNFTLNYLTNLKSYSRYFDYEVIIINNGSTDNTTEILDFMKSNDQKIRVINNSENLGFGKANNMGVKESRGEQLLFLSNDVEIYGDIVTPFVNNIQAKCLTGARKIEFATGWNSFRELDFDIPYLEGWCVGCYRKDFEDIGQWDERFFVDYEDIDFSYTAKLKGLCLREVELPVRHLVGQSAIQLTGGRLNYTLESQRKFCEKWQLTLKT